jgi:formate-dependent nitrite reductase membrane component NrfD
MSQLEQEQEQVRESRLDEIRHEAELKGRVDKAGVRPAGSPMPLASPQTGYYEQPLLKEPQWTPLIPLYFFVGGASGSLGVIGSLADVVGNETEIARKARWMALAGTGISSALLIVDLGRPSRFINMLRVFKPQSAMSVGSWVLSGFGASAAMSSFADLIESEWGDGGLASTLRAVGRTGCVLFGMPFHNYTGVLIGASVIPVWNNRIRSLPREFGMSGLQAAVSLLELTGETDSAALNVIGMISAAFEAWEGFDLLRTHDRELLPAKRGVSGLLVQIAGALSGPVPIALRIASLFSKNQKRLRQAAAISGIVGSLLLRYGWVRAGTISSRDWRIPMQIDESRR